LHRLKLTTHIKINYILELVLYPANQTLITNGIKEENLVI